LVLQQLEETRCKNENGLAKRMVHPGLLWVKAQTAAVEEEDRRFEILAVSEPDLSGIRKKLEEIALQENGTEASGRRDVAQRSSGSLIEVTDDKMPVGLIDPNERPD
jgi:hypothetical protein